MSRPKKILFGAVDIGYRIELYSKFIEEHLSDKLAAESLAIYVLPAAHYKTSYTYEFNFHQRSALYRWVRSLMNFGFCLFRYDIFHFISGETLLTRKFRRFELWTYKLFGKRVIMHFVGTDIRSVQYLGWKEKHIVDYIDGAKGIEKSVPWQKKLIRDAERYADAVLVSTPDLKDIVANAVYYPVVLDLDKFRREFDKASSAPKDPGEIVILHSPSSIDKQGLKGSGYIYDVLYKLQADPANKIRLILPAKKPGERPTNYSATRYELFSYFKEADIVIDQMVIGWYGLLAVEALAAGRQVICYVDKEHEADLFPDCPIHLADVRSLETVIRQCIHAIRAGKQPGRDEQLEWVRKYHTITNNHDALLKAWGMA